jgi:arylsulfatase A-like enzyme
VVRSRARLSIIVVLLSSTLPAILGSPPVAAAVRPNVLLIVADDQPSEMFSRTFMPSVFGHLVDRGATFDRAYDSSSVCCPSRSQMLTGLWEHHTGVDENDVALDRPTIAMALHDEGYRTAMIGKYLNSWNTCGPRPEFDRWSCVAGGRSSYTLVNPWIEDDGSWSQVNGYQPDLLADRVIDFIGSTPADQPFFAMYTPTTPHLPANGGKYPSFSVPPARAPSYDEETRTPDHPEYLRSFPITPANAAAFDDHHVKMGRATRALDDSVGRILASLGSRAADTLVIYISDNGFHYGEHRRTWKASPFEESVRVPMVVRYPSALDTAQPFVSDALVGNVDIAPTIADAVGFEWHADGTSLLPLLRGSVSNVRDAFLIERCEGIKFLTNPCRAHSWYPEVQTVYPSYAAIVTRTMKLIRYPLSGETQLFDLANDPYELDNLDGASGWAQTEASLNDRLDALLAPPPIDTTIVAGPSGQIHRRLATFTYFSPTRTSTYQCRVTHDGTPGAWFACDGQEVTIGGLTDGDYRFEVAGTDETGATDGSPATRTFSVGSTGPDVTLTETPARAQRSRSVAFGFASATTDATFACRITRLGAASPPWTACEPAAGASYTNLADGEWNFEVTATDPASGAVSAPPAAWLVRIDNAGPSWVFGRRPPLVTNATTAAASFAPSEALGGPITCKLGKKPAFDCSDGTFSVSSLTPGPHAVTISATDKLGNASSTKVSWQVDRTPPTVSISSAPPATTTSTTPTFKFSSTGGAVIYQCTLDAWAPTPCRGTQSLGTLAPGTHTLTVRSVDQPGNLSSPASYTWTITP